MNPLQELQVDPGRLAYLSGGYELAVVADDPAARQVQRCPHGPADVVEVEAPVEQPADQLDALLPRIALKAVEQAQRLEVGVRRHAVNVLFRARRAGPKQLHLALDALDVPAHRQKTR